MPVDYPKLLGTRGGRARHVRDQRGVVIGRPKLEKVVNLAPMHRLFPPIQLTEAFWYLGVQMTKRNLLLSSESRLFREVLGRGLESRAFSVIGDVASLAEAATFLRSADANIDLMICGALTDANTDFQALQDISREFPRIGIVILTDTLSRANLDVAMSGAALIFLPKSISLAALRISLELILLGEKILIAPAYVSRKRSSEAHDQPSASGLRTPLSARETQILQCLEEGQPNKAIARNLNMAEATVKAHVQKLLRKINVQNRTQAAMWAKSERGKPDSARQHEDALAMAERHVREAVPRIEKQRELVLRLRAEGRSSDLAESLLAQYEELLASYNVRLQRLKQGLTE